MTKKNRIMNENEDIVSVDSEIITEYLDSKQQKKEYLKELKKDLKKIPFNFKISCSSSSIR